MVNVIAPCFSLSATGLLGKALFYYDTKYGARVRTPKRTFVPPGSVWEVNQLWFRAASDRSKTLNREQRLAWEKAYPGACDSWRDIFMGKQIELWNLSPANNLTWPPVVAQSIGDIVFGCSRKFQNFRRWWFSEWDVEMAKRWGVGSLWWDKKNDATPPSSTDPYIFKEYTSYEFELQPGFTHYLWGGLRYIDGRYKAQLLEIHVY